MRSNRLTWFRSAWFAATYSCGPPDAFPVDYAIKDITLALDLAAQGGVTAQGARTACDLLQAASRAGFTTEYWPVIAKVVEGKT